MTMIRLTKRTAANRRGSSSRSNGVVGRKFSRAVSTPSYWPEQLVVRPSESWPALGNFLARCKSGAAAFLAGFGPSCLRVPAEA